MRQILYFTGLFTGLLFLAAITYVAVLITFTMGDTLIAGRL
jgi:hypothetical protein